MARYNEILVGRYNRFLTKLLSMKGAAPAPQLSGDIQVALNLFAGIENRFLESWERFGVGFAVVATAGQTDAVRFRNPSTSNMIAVFESLEVECSTNQELDISQGAAAADLPTASVGLAMDSRQRLQASIVPSTSVASPIALVNLFKRTVVAATVSRELINYENQELTILPGQALQVQETLVNAVLTVSAIWRERFLEESERT